MNAVYKVDWIEVEVGWGIRPDGTTYHKTKPDAEKFIKDYWAGMPPKRPPEYSEPGSIILTEVSQEIYDEVQEKINVRKWR